ncbi:uncharacterized protein N7469_008656 [Penicillium citrinum]|uniref:Uncharacterized protein n=1 Tax=Penicillium citrinum TaxID=5077 RepID=A0A9W9NM72_PENCI|nr:uncharacterized protein N7469_008656 [Penicillium citrinum]KAJ5222416.1 hypothetical protein N7469_008656 [Penicillium citrinum]
MPPKRAHRNSLPARTNHATMAPSRRSSRVPTPTKSIMQTGRSSKTNDLTSDNSYNLHLYASSSSSPKSVSNGKSQNASPDTPSNRRQTFQARPSRLSNVYTPTKETPKSTLNQSSRKTRRAAALEIPQNQLGELDFPETVNSLDWDVTHDGRGESTQGHTISDLSPTSASSATRSSARPRKLTTRAIEALNSQKKPRQKKAIPGTATSEATPQENDADADADVEPRKMKQKPTKSKRASKIFKQMRRNKPSPLQIKLTTDEAGQKLYEIVFAALNKDFGLSSDPEQIIASARQAFEEPSLTKSTVEDATIPTSPPGDPAATEEAEPAEPPTKNAGAVNGEANVEPIIEPPKSPSIKDFEKIIEPELLCDGWARTGYINKSGEEFLLTPPETCPYRAPHTYADDKLPLPPFATEDIAEEKARAQACKRKRSQFNLEEDARKAKRRQPSKYVANGTTTPRAATPAAATGTTTETATIVTAATATQEEKPKIQRLKLKLKPPTDAEREESGVAHVQTSNTNTTSRGAKSRGQSRGGRGGTSSNGTPRSKHKNNNQTRGSSRGGTPRGRGRGRGRG